LLFSYGYSYWLCSCTRPEKEEAANKRFFITAGKFNNVEIAKAIAKGYPDLKDKLPPLDGSNGGGYPDEGLYEVNTKRAEEVLGIKWRDFDQAIIDTVKSLQAVGA